MDDQRPINASFLNGFHPLIPWLAFLFLGIALGRHLQSHPKSTLKLGLGALVMAVSVELISAVLLKLAIQNGINTSEIKTLLGTTSMPSLPQYVLAAGCCSVAVICGCRWVGDKLGGIEYCVPLPTSDKWRSHFIFYTSLHLSFL